MVHTIEKLAHIVLNYCATYANHLLGRQRYKRRVHILVGELTMGGKMSRAGRI